MDMKKITIGITTYNRLDVLKVMARSFYASKRDFPYSIRIYDDVSSEYSIETIRDIFPDAISIIRNENNLGADKNIASMYQDFLKHDDDILFNADSDLLFNIDWMSKGIKLYLETDGVLSLFNTLHHKIISNKTLKSGDVLCVKQDLGSAGTLMSRENVERIFNYNGHIETKLGFDWQWSSILIREGVKLYAVKNSLVQHIGLIGQNSFIGNADYGEGFIVSSVEDGQVINDILSYSCNHQARIMSDYSLFPFEFVPKGSRVVIYGAGKVGKDFIQQLNKSNYAILVGVVDRIPNKQQGIMPIDELKRMDFDYIVLATKIDMTARSMRMDLQKKYGSLFEKKIIEKVDKSGISLLRYY